MANDLVDSAALVAFGHWDDDAVDAAVAGLRRDAGWHIAPRRTETLLVESWGGPDLWLPTRAYPEAPVVVTAVALGAGQVLNWALRPGAWLRRSSGWPAGYLSVTLTHGLTGCPAELLPVIAARADQAEAQRPANVTSFTNGGVQMAFADLRQVEPELAPYCLPAGVA